MTARVVLKGSRTYKFQGTQWIRNVPRVISGRDLIEKYQQNGFFHVKVLKEEGTALKKEKVKAKEAKAEVEEPKEEKSNGKASKGKKLLKK
jgi:hypothetical protein